MFRDMSQELLPAHYVFDHARRYDPQWAEFVERLWRLLTRNSQVHTFEAEGGTNSSMISSSSSCGQGGARTRSGSLDSRAQARVAPTAIPLENIEVLSVSFPFPHAPFPLFSPFIFSLASLISLPHPLTCAARVSHTAALHHPLTPLPAPCRL